MKKTNLLALSAAAALLATSCSKDQVAQSNPGDGIRFSALTNSATKATEVTSSSLAEYKVFGRYATSSSLDFDETYTKSVDTWSPASGITHYWPTSLTENVTFFAHSPANLTTSFPDAVVGAPTTSGWTISGVKPAQHATGQVDLVYARFQTNRETTTGAVPLTFKHVFSQVELKALCGDNNMKVTVYGAKIFGFAESSDLNFPTGNTVSGQEPTQIWSATSSTKTAYMVGGSDNPNPVVLNTEAAAIMGANGNADGNFMVIPQNLSTAWNPSTDPSNASNGAYIGILCKIEKSDGSGGYTQIFPTEEGKVAFTGVQFTNDFQKNKKYSIVLKFFHNGGGGGIIPPDPIDPTDPVDPGIVDPGDPGTPVLAPISFTVDVTGWTNADAAVERPLQ